VAARLLRLGIGLSALAVGVSAVIGGREPALKTSPPTLANVPWDGAETYPIDVLAAPTADVASRTSTAPARRVDADGAPMLAPREIEDTGRFSVHVCRADSTPVGGARVEIVDPVRLDVRQSRTTNDNGRAVIEVASYRIWMVRVSPPDASGDCAATEFLRVSAGGTKPLEFKVTSGRARTFRAVVLDRETRRPVPDARATARTSGVSASAGARGAIVLTVLTPFHADTLRLEAPDSCPVLHHASADATETVYLRRAARVQGVVRASDERLAGRLTVQPLVVVPMPSECFILESVDVDAHGRFELQALPSGVALRLEARCKDDFELCAIIPSITLKAGESRDVALK
jgi:hypothetical protein